VAEKNSKKVAQQLITKGDNSLGLKKVMRRSSAEKREEQLSSSSNEGVFSGCCRFISALFSM
jgi:hypothetical protein